MNYATHNTDQKSYEQIIKTGKFKPSNSGWVGPGLYAYNGKGGKEGKGIYKVYFLLDGLKLYEGGLPEGTTQKEWNKIRSKNGRIVDRFLFNLGYDGEIDSSIVRIYTYSVDKIKPIAKLI